MPNCIQLINKTTNTAVAFTDIDEELCKHFNQASHPTKWLAGWYDFIAFNLAMGRTWQEIHSMIDEYGYCSGMRDIAHYLEENYIPSAWVQVGK